MKTFNKIFAVVLFLITAATSFGQSNWYVSSTGSDGSGDGSIGNPWATIQFAINNGSVVNGDTINVANGTYNITSSITISKSLFVRGESEASTIINANANGSSYGIRISTSNVTLTQFTINPPLGPGTLGTGTGGAYCIHVSNTPSILSNINISHVTIQNGNRTGIDFNGVDNVNLSYVTSQNAAYGNGISLSGVHNANVTNVTTGSNAWGGIAVYVSKPGQATRGSDSVYIDASTCTISEWNKVYAQDEAGLFNTNVTVNGYDWIVKNDYNASLQGYTLYVDNLANAAALAVVFKENEFAGSSAYSWIKNLVDNEFYVESGMKIQTAINAASAGDIINVGAGTFTENIDVNKHVSLIGTLSGNNLATFLNASTDNPIITLSASGNSALDPVLIQNFDVHTDSTGSDYGKRTGIRVAPTVSLSYLKIDNVTVTGNNKTYPGLESGFDIAPDASVTNLVISNSLFQDLSYGIISGAITSGNPGTLDNVTIHNCEFNHNSSKGLYFERLSNAVLSKLNIHDNGNNQSFMASWAKDWACGLDINLKYGSYTNITLDSLTVTNNALGSKNGMGIGLKARDDSPSYNTVPASLTNVTISNSTVTGNERGIRVGEPGKNNTTPSGVVIKGSTLTGNVQTYAGVDGTAYGDLINYSLASINAENNWWGSADESIIQTKIYNYATVDYDPWVGKPTQTLVTNASEGTPISIPNTDIDMTFTVLPPATNATITVQQTPDIPGGVPPPPDSTVADVYLTITATGLANYQFYVKVVLDVSGIAGFDSTTVVMRYESATDQWVVVNGSYDEGTQTFTFWTDHFTTFAFLLGPVTTQLWDLTIGPGSTIHTYTGAQVMVPVKINLNGNAGFKAFQGKFHYDPSKLQYQSVNTSTGTIMNSQSWFAFSQSTGNSVDVLGVGLDPLADSTNGTFFYLVFKVIDSSVDSTDITGLMGEFKAEDVDSLFTVTNGRVAYTIPPAPSAIRGDATLDFTVNMSDVLAIIDHLNNVTPLTGQAAINADADSSGTITISDINNILYYIANNSWPSPSLNIVASPTINFGDALLNKQGLLAMPVDIKNPEKVKSLELYVQYDPKVINYRNFSQKMLSSGNFVSGKEIEPGKAKFVYATGKEFIGKINPGSILFKPNSDLPIGTTITSQYKINGGSLIDGPTFKYGSVTGVKNDAPVIPTDYSLTQNYPNPFNPTTRISYSLPANAFVSIKIYDVLGREVKTLVSKELNAGSYSVDWNGDNEYGVKVASGMYIYRITANNFIQTKKMVLLK